MSIALLSAAAAVLCHVRRYAHGDIHVAAHDHERGAACASSGTALLCAMW